MKNLSILHDLTRINYEEIYFKVLKQSYGFRGKDGEALHKLAMIFKTKWNVMPPIMQVFFYFGFFYFWIYSLALQVLGSRDYTKGFKFKRGAINCGFVYNAINLSTATHC